MKPIFLGKDSDSPHGDSPSVWDDGDCYVIQGPRVTGPDEVAGLLAEAGQQRVPDHETLIKFPKRLMTLFPEVAGGGSDSNAR
jgi:hypothetical protein